VVAVLLGGGLFFWGDKHALDSLVVARATSDQLTSATIVTLVTTSSFAVLCNLDQTPATNHAGDAVTVVAEGSPAQRRSAGVLLRAAQSRTSPDLSLKFDRSQPGGSMLCRRRQILGR
jgi:hypothetical protein